MIRFLSPFVFFLLPLVLLFFWIRRRYCSCPVLRFSGVNTLHRLGYAHLAGRSVPPAGLFHLLALILLIVALARPQWGHTLTSIKASGIDILLEVDVSGSMEAMDFTLGGQAASRLEVVKKVVDRFILERPNDRIGLIAFAGRPYLVCPLTLDHDWLARRLASLKTGMIEDGTAIGSAIASGVNRLRKLRSKSRIIILLTDGMNNGGKISPATAAETAETLGIRVYTIGAGTRGEAPMPVKNQFGQRQLMRVKVDIDEQSLQRVAAMTGGQYFRATDTRSLEKIYGVINSMETTIRTMKHFVRFRELYSWPLLAALLCLGLELLWNRRQLP